MHRWWNWYTRTLEVRMPKGVEVQVLSCAPHYRLCFAGRKFTMFEMVVLSEYCSKFLSRTSLAVRRFTLSPHLSPRRGHHLILNRPLFTAILSWFRSLATPPTSVGFMARAALYIAGCRARQKPPSSLTRNGFTDGRVLTG